MPEKITISAVVESKTIGQNADGEDEIQTKTDPQSFELTGENLNDWIQYYFRSNLNVAEGVELTATQILDVLLQRPKQVVDDSVGNHLVEQFRTGDGATLRDKAVNKAGGVERFKAIFGERSG